MKEIEFASNTGIREAQVLVECLRGTPFSIPQDMDWFVLLNLGQNHGVLPLIHRALVKNRVEIPDFFSKAVQECWASIGILVAELERLLAIFAQSGIEVMPLKGPVLGETLYGDMMLRSCTDLDILVRSVDFNRAEKLLMGAGWTASSPTDDYNRKFVRDGILVELHFRVASPRSLPFEMNETWNQAQDGAFRGWPLKAMSETDRALYLLLHGMKHGFAKLIWTLDAALALESIGDCGVRDLVERAKVRKLEQVLRIGCAMILETFPGFLPGGLVAALEESPEAMQDARDNVSALLAGEETVPRGPEIWEFYLRAETENGKRWTRRATFFIPTYADYRWIERHGMPRQLAPFIRPFRLLAKYGLRRAWRTAFPPSA